MERNGGRDNKDEGKEVAIETKGLRKLDSEKAEQTSLPKGKAPPRSLKKKINKNKNEEKKSSQTIKIHRISSASLLVLLPFLRAPLPLHTHKAPLQASQARRP